MPASRRSNSRRSQLSRLLRLSIILQTQLGHSAAELARELRVSSRTIFRDFHALQEAGIPVCYSEAKGGHVIESCFNPSVPPLNADELAALLLAARTSSLLASREFASVVSQSAAKLLAKAPAPIQEEMTHMLKSCVVDHSHLSRPEDGGLCDDIIRAIRKRRQLRISYLQVNGSTQLVQTRVAPYRLVVSPEGCFLVGRSSVHRKVWHFGLGQMCRVEITDDTYELPAKYLRSGHVSDLPGERN